jgi:capsular exopolysaccharide synthesis family protein
MSTVTPPPMARPHREQRQRQPAQSRLSTHVDPFRVLRRYAILIIFSAIVGGGLGVAAQMLLEIYYPLYTSEVLFEVRPGVQDVRDIGANDVLQDQLVVRLGMTETVLLTSRDVLETALNSQPVRDTEWFRGSFVDPSGAQLVDYAIDELVEDLRTKVVRNTNLFSVKWSTHHAADLPVVLNAIANAYLIKRRGLDDQTYTENLGVFRDELASTQRAIEDLDQQVQSFIRAQGLGTLTDPRDSQTAYQMKQLAEQIANATGALSMTQSALLQTEAKLQGTIEPSSEDRMMAEQDPSVAPHMRAVMEIETELRDLQENYLPDHRAVVRIERRMRALEQVRDSKIDEIMRRNLEAQLKQLQDQVQSLQTTLDMLEDEYEAKDLMLRDLAADQSKYQSMMTQHDYMTATRASDLRMIKEVHLMQLRSDASRVRPAQLALQPREPSFPRWEIVLPLGTLLVMGLTIGLIFLRELTDQRVKSASDLAVLPGVHVLGMIPDRGEDPTRPKSIGSVVRLHPNSVIAESYRQAYAAITRLMERSGYQSLLLAGGLPGSGTTTAATNLAACLASGGRRVVLVEGNFRRPQLAEALNVPGGGPGLGDVLAEAVMVSEAIVEVDENISLIPAGSPSHRMFELLNTRQMDALVAELRDRYDAILFDAPPAMVAGEALVLANKVDAAVLVVRAYKEQRGLVARLARQIGDTQCELLGVLLNRPKGTAGGYFKKNFATMARYSRQRR